MHLDALRDYCNATLLHKINRAMHLAEDTQVTVTSLKLDMKNQQIQLHWLACRSQEAYQVGDDIATHGEEAQHSLLRNSCS